MSATRPDPAEEGGRGEGEKSLEPRPPDRPADYADRAMKPAYVRERHKPGQYRVKG